MRKIILIIFFIFLYNISNEQVKKIKKINKINYSKELDKYIGYKYKWGGDSLKTGIDCSGFAKLIYKNLFNVNIPRTTKEMVNIESSVKSLDEIKDFDLILFNDKYNNKVGHCAIYFNGYIYQSCSRGTIKDSIGSKVWNNYYNKRLYSIKRIIK